MAFYKPDLGANPDDPFARDADGKLARALVLAGLERPFAGARDEQWRRHRIDRF